MINTLKTVACCAAFALAGGVAQASAISFSDLSEGVYDSGTSFMTNGATFTVSASKSGNTKKVGIYNTDTPVGADPDLESPFTDSDGVLDARPFGLAFVTNTTNSTPVNDQAGGSTLVFEFLAPTILTYVDILDPEEGADVYLNDIYYGTATSPGPGLPNGQVNYFDRVSFEENAVYRLTVVLRGSGGVGEIGVAPIPVPAALPLLLGGLGLLGVARRRRKTA